MRYFTLQNPLQMQDASVSVRFFFFLSGIAYLMLKFAGLGLERFTVGWVLSLLGADLGLIPST